MDLKHLSEEQIMDLIGKVADDVNLEAKHKLEEMHDLNSATQRNLNKLRKEYSHTGGFSHDREFQHQYSIPGTYAALATKFYGEGLWKDQVLMSKVFAPFLVVPKDYTRSVSNGGLFFVGSDTTGKFKDVKKDKLVKKKK